MSLRIAIGGQPLVLFSEEEVIMDLLNSSMADGLEDDFTVPFNVPIRGNEILLDHVHINELATRILSHDNATLDHEDVGLHRGIVKVMGADDRLISCSFTADALATRSRNKRLRDVDFGDDIIPDDDDMVQHAVDRCAEAYPDASHCFPMHFAPDYYGDNNPDWFPDTADYDPNASYAVDDLVMFCDPAATIQRTYPYQCVSPASAGQTPVTRPAKWQRLALGIVNHWDHENQTFYANTTANYFALTPFFYLKWIITKAMADLGLTAIGDFMADERTHQLALFSDRPLDAERQTIKLLASQVGTVTYVHDMSVTYLFLAQDETTPPNQDPDGVWDNSTMEWTPDEAGDYVVRIVVHAELAIADRLFCSDSAFGEDETTFAYLGESTTWDYAFTLNFDIDPGDVGTPTTFHVRPFANLTGNTTTLSECSITIWKVENRTINSYADRIVPAEHVPDITVGDLIDKVRDTFCLRITPDIIGGTVRFDYRQDLLQAGASKALDYSKRVTSPIENDFEKKETGVLLKHDADNGEIPDLSRLIDRGIFNMESDIPPPAMVGEFALVQSSRKLFLSKGYANQLVGFFHVGWIIEEQSTGVDDEDIEERSIPIAPMMMEVHTVDDEEFLMPYTEAAANSPFYGKEQTDTPLRLVLYHGMQPNANDVLYPFASSWDLTHDGETVLGTMSLAIDGDSGMYEQFWKLWCELRAKAEPVRADIVMDHNGVLARHQNYLWLIEGLLYIPERIPVKYDQNPLLIAEDSELLRLRPDPAPNTVAETEHDCGAMRECTFYQDFREEGGEGQTSYCVSSFKVNGVEMLGDPVPFDTPLNVIDVNGFPFVKNMVDAMNDCDIDCFTFFPSPTNEPEEDLGGPGVYHGGFFVVRYPQGTTWEIIISGYFDGEVFGDAYRYTESSSGQWTGSEWIPITSAYTDASYDEPTSCVDV